MDGLFSMESTSNSEFINETNKALRSCFNSIFLDITDGSSSKLDVKKTAETWYDFVGLKANIFFSLSTIKRTATDWTLPADIPQETFFH